MCIRDRSNGAPQKEQETSTVSHSTLPLKRNNQGVPLQSVSGNDKPPRSEDEKEGESSNKKAKLQKDKKQKEESLENSIRQLGDLALELQMKIHSLEMENKLLKKMVLESENEGGKEGMDKEDGKIKTND